MKRRLQAAWLIGGLALSGFGAGLVGSARAEPAGTPEFSATKTITRIHRINGADVVADSRTFSLSVDHTSGLQGFQQINVSWSGAHPSGNFLADPNSSDASRQEYPVVLLECRGDGASSAPANAQPDPTTCWTAYPQTRTQHPITGAGDVGAFPPYQLDRYATRAQRSATYGGVPSPPLSPGCSGQQLEYPFNYWVPFVAADGTVFNGWSTAPACGSIPPETSSGGTGALPTNDTFAYTGGDGKGSAKFDVWTADNNASLGCSDHVACSLVVVPVMGISCDPAGDLAAPLGAPPEYRPGQLAGFEGLTAAQSRCTQEGTAIGQPFTAGRGSPAVFGDLWWSASNWRNRITVPLSFAPSPNACSVVGSSQADISIYGSELMNEAATQWAPHFCLDPGLFNLKHISTPEPQARVALSSGGVEAAYGSYLPTGTFSSPVVSAPVALTGFAVAVSVDDAQRHEVYNLRLTPRLLAKLMTESYPTIPLIKDTYAALSHNPIDIRSDPEFIALNPGDGMFESPSAATLLSLSTNSDVIYALTSYIGSDPEAQAWIAGQPDPWGMVVNPAYRGMSLPVSTWPLRDTYVAPFTSTTNPCLAALPQPYLPLVASPKSSLNGIAQDIEFGLPQPQTVCLIDPQGRSEFDRMTTDVRMGIGERFVLGITSIGEVHRYDLDTAALQTQVAPGQPAKLTDGTGRTFVSPDDAGLAAAAKLLVPDPSNGNATWTLDYDAIRTTPAGAGAYPGTMVVYAQVPTSGLPATDAPRYATFLRFAAGDGQTPGTTSGQLPPGYLPMTAANGMGALVSYTQAAATAVEDQKGVVPPLIPPPPGTSPSPTPASSTTATVAPDASGSTTAAPAADSSASNPSSGASTSNAALGANSNGSTGANSYPSGNNSQTSKPAAAAQSVKPKAGASTPPAAQGGNQAVGATGAQDASLTGSFLTMLWIALGLGLLGALGSLAVSQRGSIGPIFSGLAARRRMRR